MAVPMIDDGAELGATSKDASAMAYILNETDFRDSTIYMPRNWFDTKQLEKGFEGTMGSLLAEFPSTLGGDRWKRKFSLLNWVSLGGRKVDSGIRGLRRTTSECKRVGKQRIGRLLRHELLLKLLMWHEDAANDQLASEMRVCNAIKLDWIG